MSKKIFKIFLWVFLLLGPGQGDGPLGAASEVLERILAVVNDEVITEQDLQLLMAPVAAQYRTLYVGEEFDAKIQEARREFLDKLVEDRLILSQAKRKQVLVKDAEVDEMMTEVRQKFPSREMFLKAIQEQGLTEKKLWLRFRDQLLVQKLVAYEVRSRVSVSPGEVNAYYKAHPEEFTEGESVRLRQILIRVGSRPEEEALALAGSLVAQAQSGRSFDELAKAYSEGSEASSGGEMGWVQKGQLMGEIDEKIFVLQPGEITPPIKSTLGWHLFQVAERRPFSTQPLSEVRNQIQETLFKAKLKERLEAWIQSLKENAYISLR